jgi:hypothetical protein
MVPPSWIEENINNINYFAFFSNPGEKTSRLMKVAEENGIESGIFRF